MAVFNGIHKCPDAKFHSDKVLRIFSDPQLDEFDPTMYRHKPESIEWLAENTNFSKKELQVRVSIV